MMYVGMPRQPPQETRTEWKPVVPGSAVTMTDYNASGVYSDLVEGRDMARRDTIAQRGWV